MINLMPCVDIVRLSTGQGDGTFGKMRICKEVFADTLEPRSRENQVNISSIPADTYICERVDSPKYGDTFKIVDVTGRTYILFHWGNYDDDTEGCILLGNGIDRHGDRLAVLNSRATFKEFMEIMAPYNKFILTITESY